MTCSRIKPRIRLEKTAIPTEPADLATWVVEEGSGGISIQEALEQLTRFFLQDLGEVQDAFLAERHGMWTDKRVQKEGAGKGVAEGLSGERPVSCRQEVLVKYRPRDLHPKGLQGRDFKRQVRFPSHKAPAFHLQSVAITGNLGAHVIGIINLQGPLQVKGILVGPGDPEVFQFNPGILEGSSRWSRTAKKRAKTAE